jgi:hypothetical protein
VPGGNVKLTTEMAPVDEPSGNVFSGSMSAVRIVRLLPGCLLALLLAVAALVTMPATGRAETSPHWFAEGKLVGSEAIPVKGTGGEMIVGREAYGTNHEYGCLMRETETISNPPGGGPGVGETLAVHFGHCEPVREPGICGSRKFELIPRGLPWHSHLARETPNRVNDVFEGVALEIRCKKSSRGVFSGTLHAYVENSNLFFEESERDALSNGSEHVDFFSLGPTLKGPHGLRKISAA